MVNDPFDIPPAPAWDGSTPRGPATADEALVMVRRSNSEGLGRRRGSGADAPIVWPDAVPGASDSRQMGAWRLDPEALAYAKARAAIESTTLSAVIDRLLRQYAAAAPGTWPTGWETPGPDDELDPTLPGV